MNVDYTGETCYYMSSEKCLRPMIANTAVFLFPNFILSRAMLRAKGIAFGGQLPLAMGLKPPFARSIAFLFPDWTPHMRDEEWKARWREYMRYQSETARAKRKLLKTRGHFCQHCGRNLNRLHAHHLVHKAHGGTNDPSNLILLCADCHQLEHDDRGVGR